MGWRLSGAGENYIGGIWQVLVKIPLVAFGR